MDLTVRRLPRAAVLPAMLGFAAMGPCAAGSDYFADEVWSKVASGSCLKCHQAGGDAEDSDFVLLDPARDDAPSSALASNRGHFVRIASVREEDGRSRILAKVVGDLDHGGEDVLAPDSTRFRILEEFVRRVGDGNLDEPETSPAAARDTFLDGVEMIDDQGLLRRLALSLAARLPTPEEERRVESGGLDAVFEILDALMNEDAFYDRLAEGFEDIFLTTGIDDVAENVLSYEHFEKTRHWYQHWDFSHIEDEKERERAGWRLADEYRDAMQREPMELVKHIVRNDRPFTEIITADYIMVSPFTARGYGIFDEVRERFRDPDDHLEFVPVRLPALRGRSDATNQESATGFYPHAGILSTFQYLKRYPTTETNRNRLRVRMYYQHFLGIDIMALAPRVNDAAAITASHAVPVMEAADCVVCHRVIDPVAGLLQDYYALDGNGVHLRRPEGWFTDMFPPGHEGEPLPESERWRALQWLGERTARDPRFAVAMVEHAWYLLAGRSALRPPEDIEHPLHPARRRAYDEQRRAIDSAARTFADAGFNFRVAIRELARSPIYRADGLSAALVDPARMEELHDVGVVRLLTPEQLERKLAAVFGDDWGRLHEQFKILYGGIDSKEVTERIADPSGAMGAIQRMMANEIACRNTALDFARDPAERRLFPGIEPDVLPEPGNIETEARIRAAIVHLHAHVLGRRLETDHPEIDRTFALFRGILTDAQDAGEFEKVESYFCGAEREVRFPDPHYTVRAWRGVVTYLLRRFEFLYE